MTLDGIREAYPHLGLALYAYEPGGPVNLEIHTPDGDMFSFCGPSEAAVLASAFPDAPEEPEPEDNVFD